MRSVSEVLPVPMLPATSTRRLVIFCLREIVEIVCASVS